MKKIFIVTGEASGDLQASLLVENIKNIDKEIEIHAIGGDKLKNQNVKLLYHINDIAILGFIEVIKHINKIRKILKKTIDFITKNDIKHVILIDYPGFNLKLAKELKKRNINVIYYISPQIWAWGQNRIHKIKKYVDKMIVILPFEKQFYKKYNFEVEYVGYPLLDMYYKKYNLEKFRQKYSLSNDSFYINIQPGSRKNEIIKLLPVLSDFMEEFKIDKKIHYLIPRASTISKNLLLDYGLKNKKNYTIIDPEDYYKSLKFTNFVITASGTSTLESAIFDNPMIIVYNVNYLTYFIAKKLIKINNIGLVNIVLEENVFPELIQNDLTVENLIKETNKIINNYEFYIEKCRLLKEKLGKHEAAKRAAESIYNFLKNNEK